MNPRHLLLPTLLSVAAVVPAIAGSPFSDLAKSVTESTSAPENKISLPADLVGGLKNLASSFNFSQINSIGLAKNALSALSDGHDSKALSALDQIAAAKLTDGQIAVLKTARTAVDAYVLQHNFSGIPAVQTTLNESISLIKSGDLTGVAAKLQGIADSVKPTAEQKAVLDSLVAHYQAWSAEK